MITKFTLSLVTTRPQGQFIPPKANFNAPMDCQTDIKKIFDCFMAIFQMLTNRS